MTTEAIPDSFLQAFLSRQDWYNRPTSDFRLVTYPEGKSETVFLEHGALVAAAPSGNGIRAVANRVSNLDDAIATHLPGGCTTGPIKIRPGEYYPLIQRNGYPKNTQKDNLQSWAQKRGLRAIHKRLHDALSYVEPHKDNRDCYGQELRNLLYLACTEIEASFRAILKANGYTRGASNSRRRDMNDYIQLAPHLRLNEFKAVHRDLIGQFELQPFENWGRGRVDEDLPWYKAYNETKHDVHENLHHATLGATLGAIAALSVIVVSQAGNTAVWNNIPEWSFFVHPTPTWKPEELYFDPPSGVPARAVELFTGKPAQPVTSGLSMLVDTDESD